MSYHYTPDSQRSPLDKQPANLFSGAPPSFKTNVNRMKTKRWVEAKAPSYDDWDDYDDGYAYEPPPPPPAQSQHREPVRSFTEPQPMPGPSTLARKHSFDAGDDQRAFGLQPTLNIRTVPQNYDPQSAGSLMVTSPNPSSPTISSPIRNQAPVAHHPSYSPDEGPVPSGSGQSSTAGWDQSTTNIPSAQVELQQRCDFSPSALPQPLQTRASPAPSDTTNARFPPRKSSLSRPSHTVHSTSQQPPSNTTENPTSPLTQRSPTNKTLPLIRPADIYKRMEEERERERRSIDSSRRSIDSNTSRPGDDVTSNRRPHETTSPESLSHSTGDQKSSFERPQDEVDSTRHLRSTLETVAERKSEYLPSFSLSRQDSSAIQQSVAPDQPPEASIQQSASPQLVFTQPQVVSTSRINSNDAPVLSQLPTRGEENHPNSDQDAEGSGLSLPEVSRFSTFGEDFWSNTSLGQNGASAMQAADNSITKGNPKISDNTATTEAAPEILQNDRQIPRKPSPSPSHSRTPSATMAQKPVFPQQEVPIAGSFPPAPRGLADAANETAFDQADLPTLPDSTAITQPESKPNLLQDYIVTEGNLAPTTQNNPQRKLESLEVEKVVDTRKALNSTSSDTASRTSSPVSRSLSPTKGRVKDLAGKFDEIADSRRNSTHSISSKKGYFPSAKPGDDGERNDSSTPTTRSELADVDNNRPSPIRDTGFRPKLPGQWESFTTATGSITPPGTSAEPRAITEQPQADSPIHQGKEGVDATTISEEIAATPNEPEIESQPLVALVSAGDAMGVAIKASLGDKEQMEEPGLTSDEPTSATSSRVVGDIYIRPLAPERASPSITSSSDTPTPPLKDSPSNSDPVNHTVHILPVGSSTNDSIATKLEEKSKAGVESPDTFSVPKLSTDPAIDDEESDRLRKEIVLSLSPSKLDVEEQRSSSGQLVPPTVDSDAFGGYRDSSILPAEYDSYWAGADDKDLVPNRLSVALSVDTTSHSVEQTPVLSGAEVIHSSGDNTGLNESASTLKNESHQDFLGKRFSWEQGQTVGSGSQPSMAMQSQPMKVEELLPAPLSVSSGVSPVSANDGNVSQVPTPLSVNVSPEAPPSANIGSDVSPLEPHPSTKEPSHTPVEQQAPSSADPGISTPSKSSQPRIPNFRGILAMKSPADRITTFNQTRDQFANSDSGLRDWLIATLAVSADHGEPKNGLGSSSTLPHPGPGATKHRHTPSLSLFGKGSTPYYQQYIESASQVPAGASTGLGPNSPTIAQQHPHEKLPSAPSGNVRISSHQMQAKGKDLLHTAGVLGGKATTSARGLFAKGKSKFRGSGSEKVDH